jgi:integrase
MRRSEVAHLKIGDIDSQRMILRVDRGKGGKSRDLPAQSPTHSLPRTVFSIPEISSA